jgi:hypothetical protein
LSELLNHLKAGNFAKMFLGHEFTNATNFLYTALIDAVIDEADLLVIARNGFKWYKDGVLLDTFLGGSVEIPEPSYNLIIYQVLTYDEIVRKYTRVELYENEKTTLRLLSS